MERLKTPPPPDDEKTRAKKAVSPATVNREFAFLKHVYNIAIRDGKTLSNPVAKLKMLRESSGRVRYLSDEEELRLMKILPTTKDRDRVTLLLDTGFRRGEFPGLRWCDVDFKAGVLTIPKSKNGETRHVPMTSTVRAILSHLPRRWTPRGSSSRIARGTVTYAGRSGSFLRQSERPGSKISASMISATRSRAASQWKVWTC